MQTWVPPLQAVKSGVLLPDVNDGHTALVPVQKALDVQSVIVEHTLEGCEKVQSDSQHAPWDGLQVAVLFNWQVVALQQVSVQSFRKPQSQVSLANKWNSFISRMNIKV